MTVTVVLFTFTVATVVLREGVVMLRSLHGGSRKAVSEFNAAYAGNGKDGMGNLAFHTVPEGFSQADGNAFHRAFHHPAQGVSFSLGRHLHQTGIEAGKVEHLLGHYTRGHNAQGEPAAEMAAAAGVVETAEFKVGGEIGLAGTGMLPELLVVFAAGVFVAEKDGERGAGGAALVHAGNNFREVVFHAGRRARSAGLAAGQIGRKIGLGERNAGQHAVQRHPDARSVGFTENTDSEFITKCIHFMNSKMFYVACQITH